MVKNAVLCLLTNIRQFRNREPRSKSSKLLKVMQSQFRGKGIHTAQSFRSAPKRIKPAAISLLKSKT